MIAIIDYGMGNIHSVKKALERLGAKTLVAQRAKDVDRAEKVVLPGVGAFDDAMRELARTGMDKAIVKSIKDRKVFLGICLGMQLLCETSEEAKECKGLGLIKGKVVKFSKPGLKVPHIGWNQLQGHKSQATSHKVCPLLEGIKDDSYVYFCHSYYVVPDDKSVIAARTDYGVQFTSMLWKDNLYGVQFHPEKSQNVGIQILKNFVRL
jgi:glutamine amidotransferase